jgi:hypothetical protein
MVFDFVVFSEKKAMFHPRLTMWHNRDAAVMIGDKHDLIIVCHDLQYKRLFKQTNRCCNSLLIYVDYLLRHE